VPDYIKQSWQYRRHHERFVRFVESKRLPCMDCHGRGGRVEVILDDGTGPFEACGWCEGTGLMTPMARGQWLSYRREAKRAIAGIAQIECIP